MTLDNRSPRTAAPAGPGNAPVAELAPEVIAADREPSPLPLRRLFLEPRAGRTTDLTAAVLSVLVGAVLRLADLGAVGLNSDEAVYSGQAASLAGNPAFTPLFPVVRAHPLLFQVLVAPLYQDGAPDVPARVVAAGFGIATIVLVLLAGAVLYSRRVGVIAAAVLAVMPYHVLISRQVLLDGPMTFFATAALVCLALLGRTESRRWLVAAGAMLGLAALSKETGVLLWGSVFAFLAVTPKFWRPARFIVLAVVVAVGTAAVYPIVTSLSGGTRSGQSYLMWQLGRGSNHDFTFYLTVVPLAMGLLVVFAAIAGVVVLRARNSWREALLASWIAVPFVVFEIWPVKGFPYLLLTAPALVLLAGRTLGWLVDRSGRPLVSRVLGALGLTLVFVSLLVPGIYLLRVPPSGGLAGAGGTPGAREAATWIAADLPADARLMTIGPSMANLIQYYSGRASAGLSVSPNPMRRNPSYEPILNPDRALRAGQYEYVVWDAFSAGRSPHFADKALTLARRFQGEVVHSEYGTLDGSDNQPLVVIYRVTRPADSKITAGPAPVNPIQQPDSTVVYICYLAALATGAAAVGWACVRRRPFGARP